MCLEGGFASFRAVVSQRCVRLSVLVVPFLSTLFVALRYVKAGEPRFFFLSFFFRFCRVGVIAVITVT